MRCGGDRLLVTSHRLTEAPNMTDTDVLYADPGFRDDGVRRYPLDTEEHVHATWAAINEPDNAARYSTGDLRRVRGRAVKALRQFGVVVIGDDDEDASEVSEPQISPVSSATWCGIMTVEGVESGDSRMFMPDSLTWDQPPLPLMWQKETSHGGNNNVSVRVGSIDRVWREPVDGGGTGRNVIMGAGTIDLGSPDGREVFRRMQDGYLSGNSVDVDSVKNANVELRYPKSTADQPAGAVFGQPDLTIYKQGRVRATTLVEIPAFTEARLALVDVTDQTVPMADTEEISDVTAALVAATSVIEITDAPPREWFNEPTDVESHGALTVTSEGRIFGYVAPSGVRHRSFPDRSQYVPLGNVDYSRFMSGETIVADGGRVATGAITMDCSHATTRRSLTAAQASEHYDNSCTLTATACVGENENGVWIAGALLPDLTPATVQRIMACKLSGDWRAHLDRPGWREFVAALLVPVPGFPMARRAPSVETSDGQLVASSVPVWLMTEATVAGTKDEQNANLDVPDSADLNVAARRVAASRGWAMPDGSYPIRDAAHHGLDDLDKAVRAVGRGGASHAEIRRHIMKRATSLGAVDRIPTNWKPSGELAAEATTVVATLTRRVQVARLRGVVAGCKTKGKKK